MTLDERLDRLVERQKVLDEFVKALHPGIHELKALSMANDERIMTLWRMVEDRERRRLDPD